MDNLIQKLRSDIQDTTSTINSDKSHYDSTLKTQFPELYDRYTAIFDLLRNNKVTNETIDRLEYMFSMSKKVADNKVSEHDASVEVGQRLVDDIVKPQLDK